MNEKTALENSQQPKLRVAEVSGAALIAEFLELRLDIDQEEYLNYYRMNEYFHPLDITRCHLDNMANNFMNNWNWIMPVVEKICRLKIGDGKEYVEYPNLRTFGMIDEETGQMMVRFNGFGLFQSDTLVHATYLAVIDFLKWWSQADR